MERKPSTSSEEHYDEKLAVGSTISDPKKPPEQFTLEEAKQIIRATLIEHELDPNFDQKLLDRARAALEQEALSHDVVRELADELQREAALIEDSPYLEVRAVVSSTDDPDMPVNTFRAWTIGIVFTIVGSGLNVFFTARNPPIFVNTFCAQVLAFPVGKLMEKILPTKTFTIFGHKCSFNPGPFNVKEHMFITICANVTFGGVGVYATDIIAVQRINRYFGENSTGGNAGFQILLTLSTQLIGFSLAGFARRFLVYPPSMIWPTNLATIALNKSFHEESNVAVNGWKISRLRIFTILFFGYGLWFVFPNAVMSCIQYFNWPSWIAPNNVKLAIITGSITGLGLNPFPTLDWSYLSALNNPLVTPLFSTLNQYAGILLVGTPLVAAIYFSNVWNTAYLPINSTTLFANDGSPYRISNILGPDFTLDVAKLAAYGPPYQTAGAAVVFLMFFASYTATISYVGLYHWRELWQGMSSALQRQDPRRTHPDVHNRLMLKYREVPEWWYAAVFVVSLVFGIVANEHYKTDMPVYGIFVAILMGALFVVPLGMVMAVTNVLITMNVLSEVIAGYALPGRALAVMIWKTYGFVSVAQAIGYSSDLKLAHYVKLAPRTVFSAQLICSIIACFVGIGVLDWQISNIDNFCGPAQVDGFTCPSYGIFFLSAIQWGTLGPERLYSSGRMYHGLTYGFLGGALLPVPFYLLSRKYPRSLWKYVSIPPLIVGALSVAPYNVSYYTTSIPIAWYFQGYIRGRYPNWWSKYVYVIATALTAACACFGVIWFFAITYKNYQPNWYMNAICFETCDAAGCPLLPVPDVGYFGPALPTE